MKNNVQINVKKLIFSLLILMFTAMSVCFFWSINSSYADDTKPIKTQLSYPMADLELSSLYNPTAVYRDDNLTAIIEDESKLTIHFNNEVLVIEDDNLKDILAVDRYDQNTLFFSANARLYQYDLTLKTYEQISLNNSHDNAVSYFDLNGEFVITAYQTSCNLYRLNKTYDKINQTVITIENGKNVAINSKGEIFLVLSDGIYKTSTTNPAPVSSQKISSEVPSKILATDQTLYFIKESKIYKMPTDGGASTQLNTIGNEEFDLGKINQNNLPTNFAFSNDNLLVIIDSTIQEFSVDNDGLTFTGFAIAYGKTAYNRSIRLSWHPCHEMKRRIIHS
jgi:hypothetical protein